MADLDGDGVDDAFDQAGRTAMMVAMQLGEKFGRLREELARNAAARDDAVAKELSARFDAERGAARAELRVIEQPEWWDRVMPQDVARVMETAETWKGLDDSAARAAERIEHEVRDRYGVDVNEFRSGAASERAHSEREVTEAAMLLAEADRPDRDASDEARDGTSNDARSDLVHDLEDRALQYERRADAGGDHTNTPRGLREIATDAWSQAQLYRDMDEATQTARTPGQPTSEAQANRADAGIVYDSAERRRATAQQMESAGVPAEDVRVRSRVDAAQAHPAVDALAQGGHAGTRNVHRTQAREQQRAARTR
nr:hypothetical protein [Microbacterium lemovicicum]